MRGCTKAVLAFASLAILSRAAFHETVASESRFAVTNSRSQYAHWIDLYDGGSSDRSDGPERCPVFAAADVRSLP